jgi:hypothetical protein
MISKQIQHCPICEEIIPQAIPQAQETCGDHICQSLRLFMLSAYSAEIKRNLKEIPKSAQAA